MIITVIDVDKNITKILDRLENRKKNLPEVTRKAGWMMSQKYAKHLKNATHIFSFPRPYLEGTIQPIKLDVNSYGVKAAKHALYVDRGRKPGKMPPDLGILRNWADRANINYYYLRASIAKNGTKARPFIRTGIITAKPDITKSLIEHFNKFVKTGGS